MALLRVKPGWMTEIETDQISWLLSRETQLHSPDVSVLTSPSLAHTGSVTCFATRECLDLISGKGSDMSEIISQN